MRASARLGQGDPELALADATAARRLFARHQRDWWRIRADLVALRARIELGRGSRRAAVALADSLADDRTEDGSWRPSSPDASSRPRIRPALRRTSPEPRSDGTAATR